MALHHATLKSAVNKYGPLVAEGKTEEEIKSEIAQDEKGFEPEGIDENIRGDHYRQQKTKLRRKKRLPQKQAKVRQKIAIQ
jgi:hypothetical protein